MKLYHDKQAVNPRRVRIFLAEKGLLDSIDLADVAIAKRETESPEFRAISPLGWLPVLELDDGTHIAESMAICRYFEELNPEPRLLGDGALECARIEQWNRHMEHELLVPAMSAFRNGHAFWTGKIEQVPDYAELLKKHIASRFDWLDGELANREWIAGSSFSVADITALCGIDFAKLSKVRIGDERPNLAAWYARMGERPSTKA